MRDLKVRRIQGTVAAVALSLAACSPVLAQGGPAWRQAGQAPPGQQKKAAAGPPGATQRQAAKQQRQAAKQQRQAAKRAQRPSGSRQAAPAPILARQAAATATPASAAPVRTVPSPTAAGASTKTRRAAAHRRALHRRALQRRAARLQATARTSPSPTVAVAAAPVAHPVVVAKPRKPVATPARPRAKAKTDQGPVTVVTRTVRDIAHVIPGWAKTLIAALAALLAVAALIIFAAAMRNRRLRALSAQLLEEVGTLSTALLPAIPGRLGALAVSVAYRPAAGLAAGGDFYDVFPLDRGRVGIVVGDVSGHGRESLGPATFIRHMVRSYLEAGLVPRAALQLAGKVVDEQKREDFATVIVAVHDPSAGTLSYATAGHPPPVISGPGGHRPLTVASAPPIGVGALTGLRQTTLPVAPGSTICFFTDGLMEARTSRGILGMPRLERIIRELPADATAEQLVARVGRESETLPDDIAVCLIRVEGGALTTSTVRVEEIEVTLRDLLGPRVHRFLVACGVDDVNDVIQAARPRAAEHGAVVLRVRLADDRSGVDVLPVGGVSPGAGLAALRKTS